jgi:hypothetical protein
MTRSIRAGLTSAALALAVAAATSEPRAAAQTTETPKLTAKLLTTNEKPAISNDENKGSGEVTITLHLTRDASNAITAAKADFAITLKGFPASTTITAAHIHRGAVATNGAVVFNPMFEARELALSGGAGSISKMGVTMPPELVQEILRGVSNFYFNVHSTANPAGVARGQLVTVK